MPAHDWVFALDSDLHISCNIQNDFWTIDLKRDMLSTPSVAPFTNMV